MNLIIISAGKYGREVFAWASQAIAAGAPWRLKGFLDNRGNALDGFDYPVGVLGAVDSYVIDANDVFVGAIGDPRDKRKYYTPIVNRGGRFVNIIHPLANVGQNVKFGTGIVLAPFASVTVDVCVGNHVSIGSFSNIAHDARIGDWSQVSSHCGINGNVCIDEGVFLGSHSCILPGRRIGGWSIIGAGSVVVKDVDAKSKAFGNPAVFKGTL